MPWPGRRREPREPLARSEATSWQSTLLAVLGSIPMASQEAIAMPAAMVSAAVMVRGAQSLRPQGVFSGKGVVSMVMVVSWVVVLRIVPLQYAELMPTCLFNDSKV